MSQKSSFRFSRLLQIGTIALMSLLLISCAEKGIDKILSIPEDFKPVYKIQKEEDVSYGNIIRKTIRISVPTGLSKENLGLNLKHAAKTFYKKHEPNAVMIFAYRDGDSVEGAYTAGRCVFAPYGEWGRAAEKVPIDKYIASIDVNEIYFKPVIPSRFGLTLAQRKKCFKEIVAAEDRAFEETGGASSRGPLAEKYKKKIYKKYNITAEQERKIGIEGVLNNWPMQ